MTAWLSDALEAEGVEVEILWSDQDIGSYQPEERS